MRWLITSVLALLVVTTLSVGSACSATLTRAKAASLIEKSPNFRQSVINFHPQGFQKGIAQGAWVIVKKKDTGGRDYFFETAQPTGRMAQLITSIKGGESYSGPRGPNGARAKLRPMAGWRCLRHPHPLDGAA
jgi:hypothetical protein